MLTCIHRTIIVLLIALTVLFVTVPAKAAENSPWSFSEEFQGSHDSSGAVLKLDSSIGYRFTDAFHASAGAPVYLTHGVQSTSTTTNSSFVAGLGNAYLGLGYSRGLPALDYSSTVTISVPTGEESKGFSTGRVTVDWNNHFAGDLPVVSPFVNLGVANTVSDTSFFVRPFSSLGFVTHLEGGGNVKLAPLVSVGGSAYGVIAAGEQTIVSKKVKQGGGSSGGSTVTSASAANDHGASGWLDFHANSAVDLEAGYSRSFPYDLNSVFFALQYTYRP